MLKHYTELCYVWLLYHPLLAHLWELRSFFHEELAVLKDLANEPWWVQPELPWLRISGRKLWGYLELNNLQLSKPGNWVDLSCLEPLKRFLPCLSTYWIVVATKLLRLYFWIGPKSSNRITGDVDHNSVRLRQACPWSFIHSDCL